MKTEIAVSQTNKNTAEQQTNLSQNHEQIIHDPANTYIEELIKQAEDSEHKPATHNKKLHENAKRLKEIIMVLLRHDLIRGITPEKLRFILEDLGPTFVKIGQIISMRMDILPAQYCRELSKLRMQVTPFPFTEIQKVLAEEYGQKPEQIFSRIEENPLGAASIAQAHRAILKDGRQVVIKVQRPGIREIMARDMLLLHRASRILKIAPHANVVDFDMVLDELWGVAQQEMDFLLEAEQAEEFFAFNKDVIYITCPFIEHRYTTSRVLAMEYIDGFVIDDTKSLLANGYDLVEIGTKLANNYVKQILDDAFFHADPHPGNIKIRDGKIVWIDFGMMGKLSQHNKCLFREAIQAVADNNILELKNIILTFGIHTGQIDHSRLTGDIDDLMTRYASMDLGQINMGRFLEEVLLIANHHNIHMPQGITLLSKGLITIEGVVSTLSPSISVMDVIKNHLQRELLEDFDLVNELRESGKSLYDSGKKAIFIPAQISDILKMTIKGQTKFIWELTGTEKPLKILNKMVNRLVTCIIIAAILIGSSLICTTGMQPIILGIPALGFLGFILALALSIFLIIAIIKKDSYLRD